MGFGNIHHKNAHFLFFTLDFPNYAEKPHCQLRMEESLALIVGQKGSI